MNALPPHLQGLLVRLLSIHPRSGLRRSVVEVHQDVQILAPTLARDIGVVSGWDEADRLGSARVQVARCVRSLLDRVRVELVLVVDDDVVRWLDVAL